MKYRSPSLTTIALLVVLFVIMLSTFYKRSQELEPAFSATINRDCAPWDGGAFTVKIPISKSGSLIISIWQPPEIIFPITFSFPNDTLPVGNVLLIPQFGPPQPLMGEAQFQSVREGKPVEGRFSLTSERGEAFDGSFIANWENQIVFCG